MNRYMSNSFVGVRVRIDGDVWLGNHLEGCQIEVDHPPVEFDGNVIRASEIRFVGEMERAARLIAKLAAEAPELREPFRKALGLEEDRGANDARAPH